MAWMRSGVRSPSAPPNLVKEFFLSLVAVVLGCGGEPKVSSRDAGDAGEPAPSRADAASGTVAGCAADIDCRALASYCSDAPCGCSALARGAPDPTCSAGTVTCFANPCMKKKAACQNGRCELVVDEQR